MRHIAESIGCNPSTISREINTHVYQKKCYVNDCAIKSDCIRHKVCGSAVCKKWCKTCNMCKRFCPDYIQYHCEYLTKQKLCNSCHKIKFCHLEKILYDARKAQDEYRSLLIGRRDGFDLTGEQIEEINTLVSPLIKKGQSPYHIKQSLGAKLCISESTLRRMITKGELDVKLIDLKEAVKRKTRRKRAMHNELSAPSKSGHLYEEYLEFISEHDISVVEMDCVEGKQEDTCAILTLHFVTFHMQLYFIMSEHTSACVVETLDKIEEALGTELFKLMFPLILTDNGHEFWDIDGMERSIYEGQRTQIFFCEPNRSDQKGSCENNHKIFRCIVPKGTSIDRFIQSDMTLATNHINSYRRKSLFGSSPYEQAQASIPKDFFILLGLELIPPEEVLLTPALLKGTHTPM